MSSESLGSCDPPSWPQYHWEPARQRWAYELPIQGPRLDGLKRHRQHHLGWYVRHRYHLLGADPRCRYPITTKTLPPLPSEHHPQMKVISIFACRSRHIMRREDNVLTLMSVLQILQGANPRAATGAATTEAATIEAARNRPALTRATAMGAPTAVRCSRSFRTQQMSKRHQLACQ